MDKYNDYVKSINNIFGILEKLKEKIPNQDNINYIDSISEYKNAIVTNAEILKKPVEEEKVEALGDD